MVSRRQQLKLQLLECESDLPQWPDGTPRPLRLLGAVDRRPSARPMLTRPAGHGVFC